MRTGEWARRVTAALKRCKYVILVALIGVGLLLLPSGSSEERASEETPEARLDENAYVAQLEAELSALLSSMQGAGEARVILTLKTGAETRYQTDSTAVRDADDGKERTEQTEKTVILSAGSAYDEAAVTAVTYPTFQGALVLCRGGDDPVVKLNCTQAVCALTGLRSDCVTVIKGSVASQNQSMEESE